MADLYSARETLRRVFGHDDFRGLQADVIGEVLDGRDVMAVLPTGGGKSFCYQVPAILRDGVGLIVSPLIALRQDQVAALRSAGVAAARLDSTIDPHARREALDAVRDGKLDLGTPQARWRDTTQSGRFSIMPVMRFSPVSGTHSDFLVSLSATVRKRAMSRVCAKSLTCRCRDILSRSGRGKALSFSLSYSLGDTSFSLGEKVSRRDG